MQGHIYTLALSFFNIESDLVCRSMVGQCNHNYSQWWHGAKEGRPHIIMACCSLLWRCGVWRCAALAANTAVEAERHNNTVEKEWRSRKLLQFHLSLQFGIWSTILVHCGKNKMNIIESNWRCIQSFKLLIMAPFTKPTKSYAVVD